MIAELGLRIRSDGTVEAVRDLNNLTTSASRAERTVVKSTANMNRGLAAMGGGFSRIGPQVQNASYQIGDFAVQIASGTSATRAFAQQAPQLLGGFGLIGAAAGAAVAVLAALAPVLLNAGKEASTAADAMDEYAEALTAYRDAVDAATTKTDELIERFGAQASAMRETLQVMQQLEMQEALEKMRNSVRFAATEFEGLFRAVDELANAEDVISGIGEAFVASADVRFLDEMRRNLASLAEGMGITSDQAVQLRDAIAAIGQASDVEQVLSATAELERLMLAVFGTVENIPPELQTMLSTVLSAKTATSELAATMEAAEASAAAIAGTDMAAGIAVAANEAARLAANLARAMAAPITPMMQDEDTLMSQSVVGDPAGVRERARNAAVSIQGIMDRAAKTSGGGGGGGAGQSEEQKLHNERLKEAERIIRDTRTEAERYSEELADLNELHKLGYLDADAYARAVEDINGAFQESQFEHLEQGIASVSDAIADAISSGENLEEAFRDILAQMVSDILSSNIQNLLTQMLTPATGAGGGGILAGLFGGLFGARGAPAASLPRGVVPSILHGGGVVGIDGYGHGRSVSASIFADAPRYHRGGIAGLMPGEVPAILQRGETVIPKGGSSGLQVNVYNAPSNPRVEQKGNRLDIDFDTAVAGILTKPGSKAGQAMAQTFGARRRARGG